MASYPAAVKTFSTIVNGVTKLVAALFNSPNDEITAIETELGTDPAGSVADVKTRLAVSLNDNGTIKTDAVITTMLKTATGEVSVSAGVGANLSLPGGTYGFYPQVKGASAGSNALVHIFRNDVETMSATYATIIGLFNTSYVCYAQQRYVTASGQDHWLFLLVDKTTKEIIGAYSAPDHPAYGNGGNFTKMPHPFGNYDDTKHEIILVDNATIAELKIQVTEEKSLLTLVNELYKPDMSKEEVYKPLHSGKYINENNKQVKQLMETIPDYIKVRKLLIMTLQEKTEKNQVMAERAQKVEQDKQDIANSIKTKLGLSDEELKYLKQL